MKPTHVTKLLGIDHPVIQAAMPWTSNPELAAAVSQVGGLGLVTPTASMDKDGTSRENLRVVIHRTEGLTDLPFGVGLNLSLPEIEDLVQVVLEEEKRIIVTYAGSPALYTSHLKDAGGTVLHLVGSVRHALAAEARGADAVIAEGFEGGGLRSRDETPMLSLVSQVRDMVGIPVIASGGIVDDRGLVAAMSLGAESV